MDLDITDTDTPVSNSIVCFCPPNVSSNFNGTFDDDVRLNSWYSCWGFSEVFTDGSSSNTFSLSLLWSLDLPGNLWQTFFKCPTLPQLWHFDSLYGHLGALCDFCPHLWQAPDDFAPGCCPRSLRWSLWTESLRSRVAPSELSAFCSVSAFFLLFS